MRLSLPILVLLLFPPMLIGGQNPDASPEELFYRRVAQADQRYLATVNNFLLAQAIAAEAERFILLNGEQAYLSALQRLPAGLGRTIHYLNYYRLEAHVAAERAYRAHIRDQAVEDQQLTLVTYFPPSPPPSTSVATATIPPPKSKTYQEYEAHEMTVVPANWDLELARRFNVWLSARDGHPAKPIVVLPPSEGSPLGEHAATEIRLFAHQTEQTEPERWRTFWHELAHYTVMDHDYSFVVEENRVYHLWFDFLAEVHGTRTQQRSSRLPDFSSRMDGRRATIGSSQFPREKP